MRQQVLSALALVVAALACAGEAGALVQRTFVSGLGSDANPCSRTEPCRTFAAAIAQTLPGGEVVAIDSAGYGPVTIDKAISLISPPGVYAGITTTVFGDAIVVNAGANDVVVLKGLSLSGLGLGHRGVQFVSGKAVRVEGLTISGFFDTGINFEPTDSARLTVSSSLIRDNGGSGIFARGAVGELVSVGIDGTRLMGNQIGLSVENNSRVSVRDSIAAGNEQVGFGAFGETSSVVNLENCLADDNLVGVSSNGLVRVAGTTVTDNTLGLASGPGASIFSRGNNTVEGNDDDGLFTGPFAAK